MAFNYTSEKRKFDAQWKQLRTEYEAAGMDADAIQAMYDYDWTVFKKERTFRNHNQQIPTTAADGEEVEDEKSPLLKSFMEHLAAPMQETAEDDRYGWVDTLDNSKLLKAIQRLDPKEFELLTLFAIEGYTVVEIARMQEVEHWTISRKITRLKNFFKNF